MSVERYPTNDELAYEARRKEGFAGDNREGLFDKPVETETPYALDGNKVDGYLGTDPSYMTYANETDKPLRAGTGVQKALEQEVYDQPTQFGSLYAPAMDDPRQLALDAKKKADDEAEAEKARATEQAAADAAKAEDQNVAQTAAPVAETNKANSTSTPPAPAK